METSVLEELEQLENRLVENMKRDADWGVMEPHVERLLAMDVRAAGDTMVADLIKSFGYWGQEKMTGKGGQEPLGAVVFEWAAEDQEAARDGYGCEAGAYGFGRCVEKTGEVFIPRPEYDLGESRFDYTGGVNLDAVMRYDSPENNTKFIDLIIFTVAEALHHAIARAIQNDAFSALNKQSEIYFLALRHDRWAAKAYHWKSQEAQEA